MDLTPDSDNQKNKWPTPIESIGLTSTKISKRETPWPDPNIFNFSTISRSHRHPKKFTRAAFDLPPLFPKTGIIKGKIYKRMIQDVFYNVLNCDSQNYSINEMTAKLCDFMIYKDKKATVKNKQSGVKSHDLSVRSCLRITSKKLPSILAPVLEPTFSRCMKHDNFVEARLDPTHCDLLLYQQKDFFGFHRDQILDFPFDIPCTPVLGIEGKKIIGYDEPRGRWYMYSVILCIDSNLGSQSLRDDGNTIVCLPTRSFLENPIYRNKVISDMQELHPLQGLEDKHLAHHVFHQSVTHRNFLIFPSNASHASAAINQIGGYKFALKLDLWVLVTHEMKEIGTNFSKIEMELYKAKIDSRDMFFNYKMTHPFKKEVPNSVTNLKYGPGAVFHSCSGLPSKCACKRCDPRPVEIKHITENLHAYLKVKPTVTNKFPMICLLPRDILFLISAFLEISRINNCNSVYSFRIVDNKSLLSGFNEQLHPPKHYQINTVDVYNYRLCLKWAQKENTSFTWTPGGNYTLFHTGKLNLLIKDYSDYYSYIDDRHRQSGNTRGDCICDRVYPWLFEENTDSPQFKMMIEACNDNNDDVVCRCTCLGCIKYCVHLDDDSDYYDDEREAHCNAHSDSDYAPSDSD